MQVCRASQVSRACTDSLPRDVIMKERHTGVWTKSYAKGNKQQGTGWSSHGWDSRCLQSIRSQQSILSQTPLFPLAQSVLKATGSCTFCLGEGATADCQPRLQLRGIWHAYQVTQPETNLAILLSCKWFSQEDMHLYLPIGRKALLLVPEAKMLCIWPWIFTTNLGRSKRLPNTALLPPMPREQTYTNAEQYSSLELLKFHGSPLNWNPDFIQCIPSRN